MRIPPALRSTRHPLSALAAGLLLAAADAQGAVPAQDLGALTLEQLANIEITSVSGYAQQLSDAPASIYVITSDDIRRSGARTLPEALRLAPNLEVARASANSYAITARGFNNADNKLLVLLDGRILYTPLFSGVLWYAQDVMLEDVERIEVISGPGSTLWGSNAVNGVINVITKRAGDTQGQLVAAGAGNQDRSIAARSGGAFAGGKLRIYAKTLDEDEMSRSSGTPASDARERTQAGFRADWDSGLTVQGDLYRGHVDQFARDGARIAGANLVSTLTTPLAGGHFRAQAYYDRSELDVPGPPGTSVFKERLDIVDASFQHETAESRGHQLVWGGGYRMASDHITNVAPIAYLPGDVDLHWINLFAQDRIVLSKAVDLTAGVKLEHNSFTGLEAMPSLRLGWNPGERQLVWAEFSRAVRTPARIDRDLFAPDHPPFLIAGGPQFRSETADVFELGYRAQPTAAFSYSATAFVHRYRHLRSIELIDGRFFQLANQMEGTTTGVEGWATWQVTRGWRLTAGGFYLNQRLRLRPDSTDPTGVATAGNDPTNQWMLRSSFDLPHDTEVDVDIRHVATLPSPVIPAYTAVDLRVAWGVRPGLELSIVGENLFDPGHIEFGTPETTSEIPRTVFFKVSWTL